MMMIIKLNEIPNEGLLLKINQTNQQIASYLKDLLGSHPFQVKVQFIPVDLGYEVCGSITGCRTLECSFCTKAFEQLFCEKFHDLYVKDGKRNGFQISDVFSKISVFPLKHTRFSLESFLHEILVLATDFQVLCHKNCHGLCSECGCDLNNEVCRCYPSKGLHRGHPQKKSNISSPFAVLSSMVRGKVQ